ncbi:MULTISPECIES: 4-(cytidine 5'-diphospho)-2-C-methyl-D-erythritol kinase [Pacificibacter]|uniref:4-(cytidine 5'-diphospho)-2-C-methyl-D-erythritol kinase n=1 Tax=Pacificibacter TaxID=1042323 RepID=UPI001C09D2F6|nr:MULTISPECIES: 4-(cytidine 5'-diphospho)-2-C-methyl-D-erythritol kinase [Pacificibacter]MBU2934683.1 4-(cytidine 5'-diphospho)-2-C-methyl-D-erythritol kinase [Pacificibacter marinus]MDO6616875.1 4-(cytidine 5'-diphospho)-2-C-methyl-D-erythritol kinase [Pacificibacter sp. 1_MG-2023]
MVKVFAPAKINLSLHVTRQRHDGYHMLDSLVAFVDVGDQITAEVADKTRLTVTGPFAQGVPLGDSNLVVKAATACGFPMELSLDKHLPPSSGIGGGSADAAATIRAAMRLGGPQMTSDHVLLLGADVPVCLASKSTRMQGIGDVLTPVKLPSLHLVLVNPGVEVSTPAVFAQLARKDNDPMPKELPHWPDSLAFTDWLGTQRNDLQSPAAKLAPEVAAVLVALALSPEVLLTRMSGSGATCFAIYPDRFKAEAAAAQIAQSNPWWWVKAASTLPA